MRNDGIRREEGSPTATSAALATTCGRGSAPDGRTDIAADGGHFTISPCHAARATLPLNIALGKTRQGSKWH